MPFKSHEWPYPLTMNRAHKVLSEHPSFAPSSMVTETASALSLTKDRHCGFLVNLSRAAGIAVKLPAATGSGDMYDLVIGTTISSNTTTITKKTGTSDTLVGQMETASTTGATTNGFCEALGGSDVTITMNGTTQGGIVGSRIKFRDIASGKWLVEGFLIGSGTLATSVS